MTDRSRPDLDDATVEGLGKLSEALETVDQARGFLYAFHQLTGKADILLGEAVDTLRAAGATALAGDLERDLLGRNVVADRWTFQIVEDYDDGYWTAFRALDARARDELAGGDRHVLEARMKQRERTPGAPRQRGRPGARAVTSPAPDPTPPPDRTARRRGGSLGRTLTGVLLVTATVVLVLFVVFNTQTVRVSLVFGVVDLPLVIALLAAAVLGGLIVALLSLRARRRGR